MKSLLSATLHRIHRGTLLLQIFGTAGFLLLGYLWLEIPDSHLWQLAFTVLVGLVVVVGLLLLQVFIVRRLRQVFQPPPIWLSAALAVAWIIILMLLCGSIARLGVNSDVRASYWNSQLGPYLRTIFTYPRLSAWQDDAISFTYWILLPGLLLPCVIETIASGVSAASWRSGLRILRLWYHWVAVIVILWFVYWIQPKLLDWHPLHTVRGELVSVVLRLAFLYCAEMLALIFLTAFIAELLSRDHAVRNPAP